MKNNCHNCNSKDYNKTSATQSKFLNKLEKLDGRGRYYRGAECQLTTFLLYSCPKCKKVYEYGHFYYSDPESTMGLGRDEDEWDSITKLNREKIKERKEQLNL